MNGKTPFELGFRMPAEWEKHEATWLSWPKDPLTFPDNILERVERIYVEMIEALQHGERVDLLVDDQKTEDRVVSLLSSKTNVRFHQIKSSDVWMRDYGPIFVKKNEQGKGEEEKEGEEDEKEAAAGELRAEEYYHHQKKSGRTLVAATKWIFNAWGEKYDELMKDNDTGMEICRKTAKEIFEPRIVLEGGSIDVNGRGSCLTTRQCLLNKNRNPELGEEQIEKYLHDYLGITNLIWLGEGIAGDDTDGHVDDIARFVNGDTVVCMKAEEDKADENHAILRHNYELLKGSRDQDGKRLEVITIEMPPKVEIESFRLPASYANFYIGNEAVLVPTFGDGRRDDGALSKISELFPGRRVVGINCRELVYGFGGLHCVTQQQPL